MSRFFSKYPSYDYGKGDVLMLANEDPKYIYYLIRGQVREYDISSKGDEIVVNVFKPPAFFPMSWAVARIPNRYFFEAATKVAVHKAPPEDAFEFIKKNPDVMLDLLTRLYSGMDGMRRRMAHLMGGNAKNRLLFELVIECRRFGEQVGDDGSYEIRISETELGARSGLTRETVSREIQELKALGLVKVGHNSLKINDLDALEKQLGSDL